MVVQWTAVKDLNLSTTTITVLNEAHTCIACTLLFVTRRNGTLKSTIPVYVIQGQGNTFPLFRSGSVLLTALENHFVVVAFWWFWEATPFIPIIHLSVVPFAMSFRQQSHVDKCCLIFFIIDASSTLKETVLVVIVPSPSFHLAVV
jgi:hypothetical protein